MNILMAYGDNGLSIAGSSDFRINTPWKAINLHTKHQAYMVPFDPEYFGVIREKAEWADAFIIERKYFAEFADLILELRERYPTKAMIATFDDGYPYATPDMNLYEFWVENSYTTRDGVKHHLPFNAMKMFKETLAYFDAAFLPNHELVKDYEALLPCHFVNNFLEIEPYITAKRLREEDGKIVIGVGAGASHYRSFLKSGVLEALQKILNDYEHVELWIRAYPKIVDEARRRLNPKKVVWQMRGILAEEWPNLLPNFDIGLAVLDSHGKFDARRSPIKIFEHMLAKVPVIASKSPTYSDYYEYGLFCENQVEWTRAFRQVIENYPAHRAAYVPKAYEFATSIGINDRVQEEYIERIQSILDAKGHVYNREGSDKQSLEMVAP
jgi:hypothetical protein